MLYCWSRAFYSRTPLVFSILGPAAPTGVVGRHDIGGVCEQRAAAGALPEGYHRGRGAEQQGAYHAGKPNYTQKRRLLVSRSGIVRVPRVPPLPRHIAEYAHAQTTTPLEGPRMLTSHATRWRVPLPWKCCLLL